MTDVKKKQPNIKLEPKNVETKIKGGKTPLLLLSQRDSPRTPSGFLSTNNLAGHWRSSMKTRSCSLNVTSYVLLITSFQLNAKTPIVNYRAL